MDEKTITVEEFREKYVPMINAAADLIIEHPDIPEDVDQAGILSTIKFLATELEASIEGRVPEINRLQGELEKKNKTIRKLQETNQTFFLRLGEERKQSGEPDSQNDKPKKSFKEIKSMIDNLPGG